MSGLRIDTLSFGYGARPILDDVSVAPLQPGTLTALIGPNASGKSTLFRCIAGLLKPAAGSVWLGEVDLATLRSKARLQRVCIMPQFFAANAALTVFDVVLMAHKNLSGWRVAPSDVAAVAAALEAGGIEHLANAYIGELSGGQAQMVSVAQSLVRRSDVYLFDEPTSALDLRHQLDVLAQIRTQMIARNAIGIVALHDLNLAARFADQLILLGGGRVRVQGAPAAVFGTPDLSDVYRVAIEVGQGPKQEISVHAYTP